MTEQKPVKQVPQGDRDGYCKVMCSIDLMEAYMVIEPPVGEGKWPTIQDAAAAIKMHFEGQIVVQSYR